MAKRETQGRAREASAPEVKAEPVRPCYVGNLAVTQVGVDVDLTETALREWVKRADAEPDGARERARSRTTGVPGRAAAAREWACPDGTRTPKRWASEWSGAR